MRPLRWALAVLLAGTATPALAASFDCARAASAVEQRICAVPTLGTRDEQVATAYAQLRESLPHAALAPLREQQRGWLRGRDACMAQVDPQRCLDATMQQRRDALQAALAPAWKAFDAIVAGIPQDPAAAARQLRGYDGALASAWLVYLQRFVPAAGVDAATAEARFAQARAQLRRDDDFAASLLDDAIADTRAQPGYAELLLLRMQIERAGYDQDRGDYVHCFVFARQGALAYDAFGPLYGSTRDGAAPICAPQGGLFELPAWTGLAAALEPTEQQYGMQAGTIRFATFADWRVIALRATVSPLLYLDPALRQRYAGSPEAAIRDWDGAGLGDDDAGGADLTWPQADRARALALLPQARAATADWLQRQRRLSAAQAAQAADAIVAIWVIARLQQD
jgi:uncharacterized protein